MGSNLRRAKPLAYLSVVLAIATVLPALAAEMRLPVAATAFDPTTGEVLYTRSMSYSIVDGEVIGNSADYHGPDRRLIASRVNDYSMLDPKANLVELNLFDFGWTRGVRRFSDDHVELWERREDGRPREKLAHFDVSTLFDGGIEPFVLNHLDALLAGKEVRASFISLASQTGGRLRFSRDEGLDGDGLPAIRVRARSRRLMPGKQAVLRLDAAQRRLVDYRGPSDIPGEDGEPFEVLLRYAY